MLSSNVFTIAVDDHGRVSSAESHKARKSYLFDIEGENVHNFQQSFHGLTEIQGEVRNRSDGLVESGRQVHHGSSWFIVHFHSFARASHAIRSPWKQFKQSNHIKPRPYMSHVMTAVHSVRWQGQSCVVNSVFQLQQSLSQKLIFASFHIISIHFASSLRSLTPFPHMM